MAALGYLDETGLHLPDYPTVLDYVQTQMRAIYGEDLYLESDSQDGQLAAIFAEALYDCYALAASVYNSYSPASAQGVSLSRQVMINGIRRGTASLSTVTLRVVGTIGKTLTGAVAKDGLGQSWLIPDGTIIPASGEVLVTATAAEAGDVRAAAGDITTITTPMLGWHSVINPEAAIIGAAVELDAALRRRQTVSTALPSRTVLDGIIGAVASLDGVTRVKGYENDTSEVDDNGLPAHSVSLVVEGGDNSAIATAIAAKKGPGCGTHGNIVIVVTDKYGSPTTIRFWRRVDAPVIATVRIKPLSGYLAATGLVIANNLADAVNAISIGDDVLISKLYTPINAADGDARTFDVDVILLAFAGDDPAAGNLVVPYNAAASCDAANVTVEIVS